MHHDNEHEYQVEEDKSPKSSMNFAETLWVVEIVKGLGVTMRHLLKNLFNRKDMPTVSYPDEQPAYGPLFRGRHRINVREDGSPRCVACMMCATVCPARCIAIVAEESPDPNIEKRPASFEIDGLRCVMCGFCVDACPEEAIYMTGEFELAEYAREDCVWDLEYLMKRPSLKKAQSGYRPLV